MPETKVSLNDFKLKGVPQSLLDKLGILEHRICLPDEESTDMEVKAAKNALEKSGFNAADLDLIICSPVFTQTCGVPNSNLLQAKLGATKAAAFDIMQACSGIIPQLMVATNFITLGQYQNILIANSTDWGRIVHPQDLENFVVLGNGASAAVLTATEPPWGFLAFDMQTDGRFYHKCGARTESLDNKVLHQRYYECADGRLFFYIDNDIKNQSSSWARYLLLSIPKTLNAVLAKAGLKKEDVDMLVLHQNIDPLVNGWIKLCGIPREKTFCTHHKYGNLASANLMTNLNELIENGRLKDGDIVAFVAQGAGFSVGSAILRWGGK
ncbi:MAG: 3-oxoacyl-ACP synthase III family protein [Candidatus Schekmanbacteria bacterium]|nr:3-oxoacyl-ACP synthase III family protein [Candidatus Schekmanbacteria bacterium]